MVSIYIIEWAVNKHVPFFSGTTLTFSFVSETFLCGTSASVRKNEWAGKSMASWPLTTGAGFVLSGEGST